MTTQKRIIVAITGASGAVYAKRLLEALVAADAEIFLIVSQLGRLLLHDELGIEDLNLATLAGRGDHRITLLPYKDVGACVASGSFKTDGMVVIPCSSNKLAEMAHGLGDNLISRAAQVVLKERRRLIVVHREMPLGLIELRNMTALAEAGAIICPANPGFYTLPQTVDDIVNMVVGRVLDLLDVPHELHAVERGDIRGRPGGGGVSMPVYDMSASYSSIPIAFRTEAVKTLRGSVERIEHCLRQLSEADVWFRPDPRMNAIGNIILHLCGNMTQWLIDMPLNRPSQRDRSAEFAERGPIAKAVLTERFRAVVAGAEAAIGAVPDDELLAARRCQGYDTTVLTAIFHAVAHLEGHAQEVIYIARMRLGDRYEFLWTPLSKEQGKA